MTQNMLTREYIQAVLMRDDNVGMHAVGRALVLLDKRQTSAERAMQSTLEHNLRGFTPSDARKGSGMAEFYKKTGFLTPKQLAWARKINVKRVPRVCKYARQLLEDALRRQAAKQQETREAAQDNEQRLQGLRDAYNDVVDSDSEEIIKPVVDKLRALEKQLGVEPYMIGGSIYEGVSLH